MSMTMTTAQADNPSITETKPDEGDLRRIAACADSLLAQSRAFVEHSRDRYTDPCAAMMNGTIGAHLRHNLDHFGAAINAADNAEPIDYDHRARGTPVETDPDAAIEVIDELRARLGAMCANGCADRTVTVRMMLTANGEEAQMRSTLSRELAFAAHHALHHHAMMGAIAYAHGLSIPQGFGKAPSTLSHESSTGAKA
jgi:hypothetical protein